MMSNRWEKKSMAAGFIKKQLMEMQSNPSNDFKCLALSTNPYDWQFAIRGPNGTEFEGGIYHGRIQFSEEDPEKHPILTLLTKNGRFKTQTEIHVGTIYGQLFDVRIALHKLIELLPTYPDGKLGSVKYDKEERRVLAIKSREAAPIFGTTERQELINESQSFAEREEFYSNLQRNISICIKNIDKSTRRKELFKIHEYMLSKVPPAPSNGGGDIWVSPKMMETKESRANASISLGIQLSLTTPSVREFSILKRRAPRKQNKSSRGTNSCVIRDIICN